MEYVGMLEVIAKGILNTELHDDTRPCQCYD